MTLHGLDARFREAGRLRAGARNEKGNPTGLETWRITTPSKSLAQEVADAYGGDVTRWEKASGGAGGWEVFTEAEELEVVIPPYGRSLTQAYELWGGPTLKRRCDGRVQVTGERCACPPIEQRDKRKHCSPTSRLSVMLPAVSGLGVWLMSTKGRNAAEELMVMAPLMQQASAQGVWLEGVLRLEQRSSTDDDGLRRDYVVPSLDFPSMSSGQLAASTPELQPPDVEPDEELVASDRPVLGTPNEPAPEVPRPAASADRTPDDQPVTQPHLAAIHARCRELGINDRARRAALRTMFNDVGSSRDLTAGQARTFLSVLDDEEHTWTVRMVEISEDDAHQSSEDDTEPPAEDVPW